MGRMMLTPGNKIVLPAIGAAFMGGFYAGTIDTTRAGSIISEDSYQTGKKYALIVAGKSLETTGVAWATASALPTGCETRWDGLSATAFIPAGNLKSYISGLTAPSDGGSAWYVPAMDEMELLYRNFKPGSGLNNAGTTTSTTFPTTTQTTGVNPSSSPTGAAYTTTVPAQTTVANFIGGAADAFPTVGGAAGTFFTSSVASISTAWAISSASGSLGRVSQSSGECVRPVRRLYL